MPTYDYECPKCKKTFELSQKMTAPAIKNCPDCGGKVKRLIGAGAGIIFKGNGFYATDYRSDSYKNKEKSEKPSPCEAGSKKECSTCPAAKNKS
jgi:putative FmdB family regulatory protein